MPTFRNHVSVPSSKAGSSLLPAFEDGTDTWFRNVGTLHIDAGEIPKRTYTNSLTILHSPIIQPFNSVYSQILKAVKRYHKR